MTSDLRKMHSKRALVLPLPFNIRVVKDRVGNKVDSESDTNVRSVPLTPTFAATNAAKTAVVANEDRDDIHDSRE